MSCIGLCVLTLLAVQPTYGTVSWLQKDTGREQRWQPGRGLRLDRKSSRRQQRIKIMTQSSFVSDLQSKDELISQLIRENRVQPTPADDLGDDRPELEGGISRILHQSWKTRELPSHFKHWQQSWKQYHPGWEYRLWTDEDNRALVARYYSWLLPTYDGFNSEIYRADFARQLYMHRYGGIYADLDVESLQPIEPLIANLTVVLAQMGSDENFGHSLPNAFMASKPGHVFWMFVLAEILRGASDGGRQPEAVTGPMMLHGALRTYRQHMQDDVRNQEVTVLPPHCIYPLNWADVKVQECDPRKNVFNTTACKTHFPDSYALTYWTHSWSV